MISQAQLDWVLEQWRTEYGYPDVDRSYESRGSVGACAPPPIGTVADDFNASWIKLSSASIPQWRMAMALKAETFAARTDPGWIILERLRKIGIIMSEKEFTDHVQWAKAHFCREFTIRRKQVLTLAG